MRKRRSQAGYILLVTLIFLQLFIAISLFSLTNVRYALKSTHLVWMRNLSEYEAESILTSLENNVTNEQNCMINTMAATEISQKEEDWWQAYGCGANSNQIRYYYVVETLGEDPCAVIRMTGEIAEYYRITLFLTDRHNTALLQSTTVAPKKQKSLCLEKVHGVQSGRQMLREI